MFIADFREVFRSAARRVPSQHHVGETRVIWLKLGKDLYQSHLQFFRHTHQLVEKLDDVLNDFEHQLSMDEGRELGFALPKEESFRSFVQEYKNRFLHFDPFHIFQNGDDVWLSGDKVKAFIDNRKMAARLYDMLDDAIFQTEYMDLIRHLKNAGIPYAGPSVFQDIMDWQLNALALFRKEKKVYSLNSDLSYLLFNLSCPQSDHPPLINRELECRNTDADFTQVFDQVFTGRLGLER